MMKIKKRKAIHTTFSSGEFRDQSAFSLETFDAKRLDGCGNLSSCDNFGHTLFSDDAQQEAIGAVSG
jgi:hypothetical protein